SGRPRWESGPGRQLFLTPAWLDFRMVVRPKQVDSGPRVRPVPGPLRPLSIPVVAPALLPLVRGARHPLRRLPMTSRSWLRSLFARPKSSPVRRGPRLEALEDRPVPAAYHVTSLLDDGSAGTLRDAITQANANPGPDTPPWSRFDRRSDGNEKPPGCSFGAPAECLGEVAPSVRYSGPA